jgi:hypothetical protein
MFVHCLFSYDRTLGEAIRAGYRSTARCARGRREGMKSVRESVYRYELDLETLIFTVRRFRFDAG